MKVIYHILLAVFAFTLWCCQEDSNSLNNVGYLRLAVSESGQLNTRAYDPKIMHVEIQSEDGEIVKQTNDLDEWDGEVFELPVGNYGIIAYSNDYKEEPAFNSPYYYGDTTVQVKANTETSAKVDCKIANVKVTVNYSEDFKTAFAGRDIFVTVGAADEKSSLKTMHFEYGSDAALYLPSNCGPLKATLNVSKADGSGDYYTLAETERLAEPKANDHFILNYQMGNTNQGDFTVTVDPTTNSYSYTFYINMTPNSVTADCNVNAWATFAYVEASNLMSTSNEIDPSKVKLQYRINGTTDWTEVVPEHSDGIYKTRLTGLADGTTYDYCLTIDKDTTSTKTFVTEDAIELQNGGFEDWCTIQTQGLLSKVNTAYPNASADIKFWDTSNTGANTMSTNDPTNKVTSPVISGTYAAKLESKKVIIAFAAASLYTGTFGATDMGNMSATVNFGQSFTSRPIALHGYYQYASAAIDNVNSGKLEEAGLNVKEGDMDECAIYIALTTDIITVDNSDVKKLFDPNDSRVIAYGTLPSGAATNETENNGYKEFTIPLKYKNLTDKPTHIIIVCSASKYGDYMTGGEGSTLYVDEFSLVYDGTPTIWEN